MYHSHKFENKYHFDTCRKGASKTVVIKIDFVLIQLLCWLLASRMVDIHCDLCGTIFNSPEEWVQLPACASSVCSPEYGMCCYVTVCRHGCHFECVDCGAIVDERSVVNTVEGFFCENCHRQTSLPTISVYPYWGISVQEYLHRYMEYDVADDEINEYISRLYDRSQ